MTDKQMAERIEDFVERCFEVTCIDDMLGTEWFWSLFVEGKMKGHKLIKRRVNSRYV